MNHKVGDKLTIIKVNPQRSPTWIREMDKWIGKEVTISQITPTSFYRCKENSWTWHGAWLEDPLLAFLNEVTK